jgi:hypothetical protein
MGVGRRPAYRSHLHLEKHIGRHLLVSLSSEYEAFTYLVASFLPCTGPASDCGAFE